MNEVQPFTEKEDDDHDSGTESDEENVDDLVEDEFNNNKLRRSQPIPVNQHSSEWCSTHEISEHNLDRISCTSDYNLDTISCTSDYERHSLDFEHHSSEEELETIHKEVVAEKRKRLHPHSHCDSASDEEVKELMLQPQPVNFSSSPPKVVQCTIAHVTPVAVMTISSRKRHRQNTTSDSSMDSVHRPCLDFEKMQKNAVKKQCTHGIGRAKIVKIKTVNRTNKSDPAMFTFKSISSTYSSMTPVEEPSCAY